MVKRIRWTPELVNKFWNGVAQTELDSLSFGKVAGPGFLNLIDNLLAPNKTYLDYGAGSGHIVKLMLQRGLKVAGFDPAPDRQAVLMAQIGQDKNFLGIKGVDSPEQFDVVFLVEVIEHVLDDDFDAVLSRVARFIKPGGTLIVTTPNNENLEAASVYCPVSDVFFHRWQHVRSFTPATLSACLKKYGITDEFIALADFSSDAALISAFKSLPGDDADYEEQMGSLARVRRLLDDDTNLGFWQRIKNRIELLWHHRAIATELHALSNDLIHRLDKIDTYVSHRQMSVTIPVVTSADRVRRTLDGIDLRFGRETTIVYIGRKN